MAGRLGLGLQSIDRALHEPYLAGLEEGGHDPATARMAGQIEFLLADDPERAWATVGRHAAYRWNSYGRYMFEGTRREAPAPVTPEDLMAADRFVVGTAEQVAEVLRRRVEGLPVSDLYCWADYPGMPDELVDRHLDLMFRKLAPLVRGLGVPTR